MDIVPSSEALNSCIKSNTNMKEAGTSTLELNVSLGVRNDGDSDSTKFLEKETLTMPERLMSHDYFEEAKISATGRKKAKS